MRKIKKYFRGVAEEAHRIRWPSGRELWPAVAVVCGVTVVCAIVLAVSDWLAYEIMRAFQTVNPQSSGGDSSPVSSAASALADLIRSLGGKL